MATLVIGDLHLTSSSDPAAGDALVRLLRRAPDAPLVLAGDSLDPPAERKVTGEDALRLAFARSGELRRTLAERAARGVRTTFVAGNHDAWLATTEGTRALHDALGLAPEHREHVATQPWLVRLASGTVHVEHGHVFDPDGAPTHPLSPVPRDDVGICILRKFITPIGGHELIHRNQEAPLRLLTRVALKWGALAPWIVGRYVVAAVDTVFRSGRRFPLHHDRAAGSARLREFSEDVGLDAETLEMLLAAHATPTRARATSTFLRLYLDRVTATAAVLGGGSAAATGAVLGSAALVSGGLPVATLGMLSLSASLLVSKNRYAGRAPRALAEGAERVADITGARTVILGHVHTDATGPRYRNTASFAYSPTAEGRPYLRVEDDGEVSRAFA